jgi:DNA-binding FadR family transcriptional regulator
LKIRDVLRILRTDGWVPVRQRGSHRQFRHANQPGVEKSMREALEFHLETMRADGCRVPPPRATSTYVDV